MQVLAHRGASHYAPENTRAAFDLAMEQRADGLETDLRLSRDGEVVLIHDATVDRTTGGSGRVDTLTLAELQSLDAGSWFGPGFAGERMMDLGTFLMRYAGRAHLVLELKDPLAAQPALALVERYWGLSGITFTAFEYETLRAVRGMSAGARLGWLVDRISADALAALADIEAQQICPRGERLHPEGVLMARGRGFEVRAWGIRDEATMRHAIHCGVEGMTVNFPDVLVRYLGRVVRK